MENENKLKKNLSRRKFLGSTATVAAFSMMPKNLFGNSTQMAKEVSRSKTNLKFWRCSDWYNYVQLARVCLVELKILSNIARTAGISTIELMSGDVEEYLGAPKNPMMAIFAARPPASESTGRSKPAASSTGI